jgi:UDP-N-acetyl-D-mannosaminuronate dehydrogenase
MINMQIGIIGFGNLGKALFLFFKEKNIEVYYNDLNIDNSNYFKDIKWLRDNCNHLYIAVNTDMIDNQYYDYSSIEKILSEINNYTGNVIVASTTSLNTMNYLYKKYKLNIFYNPFMFVGGNELNSIKYAKNIIIGSDIDNTELQTFYKTLWPDAKYHMHSLIGAEFIKLLHNYYIELKVNFAIKVALQCDIFNIDSVEMLSSLKQFTIFNEPNYLNMGLPVGGPCIPRDSKLIDNLFYETFGITNNDSNILFHLISDRIIKIKNKLELDYISIIGTQYKDGVDSDINSPSVTLGNILIAKDETIFYNKFNENYLHIDVFGKFTNYNKYKIFNVKNMKLNEDKTSRW